MLTENNWKYCEGELHWNLESTVYQVAKNWFTFFSLGKEASIADLYFYCCQAFLELY